MRGKSWLWISALSFFMASAPAFAIDRDQDPGQRPRGGHEATHRGDGNSPEGIRGPENIQWADEREREKEWREYLRERNRTYKDYFRARRQEQDDFDDYLRNRGYRYGDQYGSWGSGNEPRNGACFYMDSNYRGKSFCLGGNDRLRYVGNGYNDKISSIRVFGRSRIVIYEHENYGGARRIYADDASSLGNFNDKVSSIEVR